MVLTSYESTVREKGLVTRDSEGNVLMRSFWGINFIIFRFWNLCIFPRTLFRKKSNSSNLSCYKTKLISQNFFFYSKSADCIYSPGTFLVHLGDRHFNSVKFAFPWQINNRCRLWTDLLKSWERWDTKFLKMLCKISFLIHLAFHLHCKATITENTRKDAIFSLTKTKPAVKKKSFSWKLSFVWNRFWRLLHRYSVWTIFFSKRSKCVMICMTSFNCAIVTFGNVILIPKPSWIMILPSKMRIVL